MYLYLTGLIALPESSKFPLLLGYIYMCVCIFAQRMLPNHYRPHLISHLFIHIILRQRHRSPSSSLRMPPALLVLLIDHVPAVRIPAPDTPLPTLDPQILAPIAEHV